MRKKTKIVKTEKKDKGWYLLPEEVIYGSDLAATGQMLVDSAGLAFIYVLENKEDYTYISLPEPVWGELYEAVSQDYPIFLQLDDSTLKLEGMKEELDYLVDNIKGNSNYGEEMVNCVERIFK